MLRIDDPLTSAVIDPVIVPAGAEAFPAVGGGCMGGLRRAKPGRTVMQDGADGSGYSHSSTVFGPRRGSYKISLVTKVVLCPYHHQVFHTAQVGVEMRLFRNIADPLAKGHQVIQNRLAIKRHYAPTRLNHSSHHLHGCRFARTVCSEITRESACARRKS